MKRYVLEADLHTLKQTFDAQANTSITFKPNFNVTPGKMMPIIVQQNNNRHVVMSSWGLVFDDKSERIHEIAHEDIDDGKTKGVHVDSTPCIVPISGFYKWKERVEDPLPFYLRLLNTDVSAVAGVYHSYKEGDRTIHTFAVLTMPANPLVEPLDERMPVFLSEVETDRWLAEEGSKMLEKGFNGNYLLPDMSVFRVPEMVNDPGNNSKELIQPIPNLKHYEGSDED